MSFILDALHKTDREKDIKNKPIPSLNTEHSVNAVSSKLNLSRQSSQRLVAIIVILLVVAVILLLVLLLRNTQGADGQTTNDQVVERKPVAAVTELRVPIESPKAVVENLGPQAHPEPSKIVLSGAPELTVNHDSNQIDLSQEAIDPEIQALYEAPKDISLPPSTPPRTLAVQRTEKTLPTQADKNIDQALAQALWDASEIKQDTPIPEHLRVSTPEKNVTITPEPKSVITETAEIDAPFEQTMAAFDTTPFLHELSENTQTTIPTLMYAEHQYVNGYVVFNRKTIQAGEAVEGVKVERILADGVVLFFEGRRFKLAALSSWVNY